jgi:hypothetical protein
MMSGGRVDASSLYTFWRKVHAYTHAFVGISEGCSDRHAKKTGSDNHVHDHKMSNQREACTAMPLNHVAPTTG